MPFIAAGIGLQPDALSGDRRGAADALGLQAAEKLTRSMFCLSVFSIDGVEEIDCRYFSGPQARFQGSGGHTTASTYAAETAAARFRMRTRL